MKVIWKQVLGGKDKQKVMLPTDAVCLHVDIQHHEICVWFLCAPDASRSPRQFSIYGTGHEHQTINGSYLGTVVFEGGALVLHVFDDGVI